MFSINPPRAKSRRVYAWIMDHHSGVQPSRTWPRWNEIGPAAWNKFTARTDRRQVAIQVIPNRSLVVGAGFSGQEYQNFEPNISRFFLWIVFFSNPCDLGGPARFFTAFPLLLESKYPPAKCWLCVIILRNLEDRSYWYPACPPTVPSPLLTRVSVSG